MGGGRLAPVWASVCLLPSSGLLTCGEGMDWPLPTLASMSFFASIWPLPTLAPANTLFGEECGHSQITLCTSPPVTLAQEVLTLGAIVGEADRVISAADEETVTVGILPPATTWDE